MKTLLTITAWLLAIVAVAQSNGEDKRSLSDIRSSRFNFEHNKALIIGVGDYTNGWSDLKGVPEDVKAVSELFAGLGFDTTVRLNPTGSEMRDILNGFRDDFGYYPDSRLVIYICGHGYTLKTAASQQMGYLIPVDAPLPDADPIGFKRTAISMEQINTLAMSMDARHVLFMFDACFAGSVFSVNRSAPRSVEYKMERAVRAFITSGDAGEEVPDHSIFRRQLEAALSGEADINEDRYITGTELGEFLADRVANYTRGGQHPQFGKIRNPNLDKGDFVFELRSTESMESVYQEGMTFYYAKNYTDALPLIFKAAESDHAEALSQLGYMYDNGLGVDVDKEKAFQLYLKSAELGYTIGQFNVGVSYDIGEGTLEDDVKASYWYQKAAEKGYAKAQYYLAVNYSNGEGVEANETEAMKWYLMAAEQGHELAQNSVGYRYENGQGVEPDILKAAYWYQQAAEQGYDRAQFNMGLCYQYGTGVAIDMEEALYWYELAAEQGNTDAQYRAALLLRDNTHDFYNETEAFRLFEMAAKAGDDGSQFYLGVAYDFGRGTEENNAKAVYWYRKAARQGHVDAQFNLAVSYENGEGVMESHEDAVEWYKKAAQQGYAKAKQKLDAWGISYE